MWKLTGVIVFVVIVALNTVAIYVAEEAYLSQASTFDNRMERLKLVRFVTLVTNSLGFVFGVVSIILYIKIRRVENRLEALQSEMQQVLRTKF